MNIVTMITQDVVGAISAFLSGMGTTIVDFFDNVVLVTNTAGEIQLSTFAGWTLAFVGIGFAASLVRKLMHKAG